MVNKLEPFPTELMDCVILFHFLSTMALVFVELNPAVKNE